MILWIWLAITIVTAIVEFITIDLVSIWFTLGGIAAMIAYFLNMSDMIQIVAFVVVSIICIISVRPLAKKYLKTNTVKTNLDRVVGQHGLVIKTISPDSRGEVKVMSIQWSAESFDHSIIEEGQYCEVLAIEGNHLIVQKLNEGDNKNG